MRKVTVCLMLAGLLALATAVPAFAAGGSGSGTYDQPAGFTGTDTFTYNVCGLVPLCHPGNVTYTLNPVNYAPVADDVSDSTNEDTLDAWTPVVSDPDAGDTLTCSVAEPTPISGGGTSINGGTVTVNSDCSSGNSRSTKWNKP